MSKTIVIVGAGTGGIVLANELRQKLAPPHRIVVIERTETHAFAPSFLCFADSTAASRSPRMSS